jgi:hypothetical protein
MTIARRNLAEAVDYSSIVGLTASTVAYPSVSAATNSLAALYGVGFADRGFGQIHSTSTELITLVKGDVIPSQAWKSLRSALLTCANFTDVTTAFTPPGGSAVPLPNESVFDVGEIITDLRYGWSSTVQKIDQKRLRIPVDRFALPVVVINDTRTTDWPDQIKLEFKVEFDDEDHARYFFNTGGKIRISPSFVPGANQAHYNSWQTMLMGTAPTSTQFAGVVELSAHECKRISGAGGALQNIGYYELTSGPKQLLRFSVDDLDDALTDATGIYKDFKANYYTVTSYVDGVAKQNGGNGHTVVFEVFFSDVYGTSAQPVKGTMNVVVTTTQVAPEYLIIDAPTITVTTNLAENGGAIYENFVDVIDSNILDYNLYARANARLGYTGVIPLRATVRVLTNVVVGSTSTTTSAMQIPSLPTDSMVILYNQGYILGKGGNGGAGSALTAASAGTSGGPALLLSYPTTLQNTGVIGGGGGGGGGSTSNNATFGADDPGGSGGGGAGFSLSQPGNVGPTPAYYGQPGGWLVGGAGGDLEPHGGSAEWWQAEVGGKGGNLGQAGTAGTGDFTGGAGGAAGVALTGNTYVLPGSLRGDIRGTVV